MKLEVESVESEIFILKEYNGNSDVVPEHAHHILVRGVWLKAGKKEPVAGPEGS